MKNLLVKRVVNGTIFPLISFINRVVLKKDSNVLLYIPNERFTFGSS